MTHTGVHWKAPFVTTVEQVQVRPRTDTLNLMSTVTKDGITNTFNDVQVFDYKEISSGKVSRAGDQQDPAKKPDQDGEDLRPPVPASFNL